MTLLVCLFLLTACGELETLIPSNGSYQVKMLVNGASLEDCSLIRSQDKIRPYFAVSVANDPDLIGILVYFRNSLGEIAGGQVRYILEEYTDAPVLDAENEDEDEPEEADIDETGIIEINEETLKTEFETEIEETEETEESEESEPMPYAFIEDEEESGPVEIAVRSFSRTLPYFPLPKNLEMGLYTLVFEVLGKGETLSRTETEVFYMGNAEFNLKDIAVYLSGLSGLQLISPETTIMLEARLDSDSRFDPYVIWYSGRNIISEGKISDGAGTILWKAPEQAGFYSLRLEAFPFRLKRKFSGLSREIALPVSPKALSLGYFFENDSQFSGRSPLAAGTVYPEQVRLLTEARLLIETAEDDIVEDEISMPSAPELLRWYQFEGNLDDSMALTPVLEPSLVKSDGKNPRWAAAEQSYGLSTEPDDAYRLSPVNFFLNEKEEGGGIFLFHIKFPEEGAIFSAFFPSQASAVEGVWIDIFKERNIITLRLSDGNNAVAIPLYLIFSKPRGLIPIVVEFYIRPYRMEAKISVGEYSLQSQVGNIRFSGALSGEGRIRLGGIIEKTDIETISLLPMMIQAEEIAVIPEQDAVETLETVEITMSEIASAAPAEDSGKAEQRNTVWDELAILFSSIPLLEEELIDIAIMEEDTEDTTAEADDIEEDIDISIQEGKNTPY